MNTTINFADIEIKDLDGINYGIKDMPKQFGNQIFTSADTIELSDLARLIHKGEAIEVSSQELEAIRSIINQTPYYKPWIMQQVNTYLNSKIITNENEPKDN